MRWSGSGEPCIEAIRAELDRDPHNAGLRRNLAGFLLEAEDLPEAQRQLDKVRLLVPRGTIPVFVNMNPATR
ncbi:MAG: tetratricopeptide repeat protein [Nitrobacter sp.]